MTSSAERPLPPPLPRRAPQRTAILSAALFSGTCATTAALFPWDEWPRWLVLAASPGLFAVGLVLGAIVARRRVAGDARSFLVPWVLVFAGLLFVAMLTGSLGGNPEVSSVLVMGFVCLLGAVPLGAPFGWATHAVTLAFSDRLRAASTEDDPARLAATGALWLAGAAVIRWILSPLSWYGSSATLAALGAAWLAWRAGRRAAAVGCVFFAATTVVFRLIDPGMGAAILVRLAVLVLVAAGCVLVYRSVRWILATNYFRSVGSSVATLAHGGGEKAMAAFERALAVAEIGALALLADGEVSDRERDALSAALAADEHGIDVDEALARARRAAPDATDPSALREAIARAGRRLDPEQRAQACRLVAELAGAGAGLTGEGGGYRGVRRTDPAALIALVADALGVPPDARTGGG